MHLRPRRLPPRAAALAAGALAMAAACGGDGDDTARRTLAERAAQIRAVAEEAGLGDDVVEVLVLAAQATGATYQVAYEGEDGARIVVSQDPPDQRVDVVDGSDIVASDVRRGGVAYRCEGTTSGVLACERTAGAVRPPGVFTDAALEAFAERLADPAWTIATSRREVAGVDARCLAATPSATASEPSTTLCLSPEGVQLLLETSGQRLAAAEYGTEVPSGTFDVDVDVDAREGPTG